MYVFSRMIDYIRYGAVIGHKVIFATHEEIEDYQFDFKLENTYTFLGVNETETKILVRPYNAKVTGTLACEYFHLPIVVLSQKDLKEFKFTSHCVYQHETPNLECYPIDMAKKPSDNDNSALYFGAYNPMPLLQLVRQLYQWQNQLQIDFERPIEHQLDLSKIISVTGYVNNDLHQLIYDDEDAKASFVIEDELVGELTNALFNSSLGKELCDTSFSESHNLNNGAMLITAHLSIRNNSKYGTQLGRLIDLLCGIPQFADIYHQIGNWYEDGLTDVLFDWYCHPHIQFSPKNQSYAKH